MAFQKTGSPEKWVRLSENEEPERDDEDEEEKEKEEDAAREE